MTDVALQPAARQAAMIRAGEISSRELLETFLERIETLDSSLNAVVTLDTERALARAAAADEATAKGESWGPLHGLPLTIKDAIETEGIRSTGGAVELTDHVPSADAPVVEAVKSAGAVVFGKTNCPRWSADIQTYNEVFGTSNNPWNLALTPGGSSGGPAAAVAAGLTSFEIGTDIGGSIRWPSHCCGIYGLKPTYGVVPQRGYLDHVGGGTTDADINVFGPIARSADDLELVLDVVAGPDPGRAAAWRLDLPAPRRSELADYRVGVWFDDPAAPTSQDVAGVLSAATNALSSAGVKLEDAHPATDLAELVALFGSLILPAVSVSFPDEAAQALGGSHRDWLRADERRAATRRIWNAWFEEFDLLLCPVAPVAAFPHDHEGELATRRLVLENFECAHTDVTSWNGAIGVLGLPSVVPPAGRTPTGLPVGFQIVAAPHRDLEAIDFARRVADVFGGFRPPPTA